MRVASDCHLQQRHISPLMRPAGGTALVTQLPSTGSTSSTVTKFFTMKVTWLDDLLMIMTDLRAPSLDTSGRRKAQNLNPNALRVSFLHRRPFGSSNSHPYPGKRMRESSGDHGLSAATISATATPSEWSRTFRCSFYPGPMSHTIWAGLRPEPWLLPRLLPTPSAQCPDSFKPGASALSLRSCTRSTLGFHKMITKCCRFNSASCGGYPSKSALTESCDKMKGIRGSEKVTS